ncbi:MAG: hypothetical protein DMF56_10095 [Acidobacteria bacterium]|nr:MAG: hypothetical protein DMF56_10095 [Acidobacteriota bacterium]
MKRSEKSVDGGDYHYPTRPVKATSLNFEALLLKFGAKFFKFAEGIAYLILGSLGVRIAGWSFDSRRHPISADWSLLVGVLTVHVAAVLLALRVVVLFV